MADLVERLERLLDNENSAGRIDIGSDLLRDVLAALEAEASKGERRGLEPTDAMLACFSDPMLSPEWVRKRLRAVLALIPEAPVREAE